MKFNIGDRVQTKLTRTPGTVKCMCDGMVAVETDDHCIGVPLHSFSISHGLFLSADAWEKISPSKILITSDGKTTLARLYDGNRVIRRAEAKCSPEDTYDFATGADLAYDRLMRPTSVEPQDKPKFKAGDKAKIIANTCHHAKQIGDIVTLSEPYMPFTNQPAWHCNELFGYIVERDMEPYTEPKAEPVKELYSGKVVCVETHDDFTVGKVYTFAQGKVTDDSWTRRPMSGYVAESLKAWNSRCGDCIVRFVEYKGEA